MKPIISAIASYGMSGIVFHGPILDAHPGFEIRKILERNKNNSEGKHGTAQLVREYGDILNDPEIELVIVNTPDIFHYEMSMAALNAGKHIVVEKPFTLKSSQADEIISLANKKGLMVSVYQNRRWDGDFMTIQKLIEQEACGRLVSFELHFDRFRNFLQDSWKEQEASETGTLYNLGSHVIDQALQLFGMPLSLYADVRAQRTGSLVDDSFDLFLHYPNVKCFVRGSYLVKQEAPRFSLHGTQGSFIKNGLDPQEVQLKAGMNQHSEGWGVDPEELWGVLVTDNEGEDIEEHIPTMNGDYSGYYDSIYESIRNGAPLAVTAESARDVIRVIEAAYRSSKNKEIVTF